MNPRYPTSRRYRRHAETSQPKPARLLLLGVCVVVAGWLIWPKAENPGQPGEQAQQPVAQARVVEVNKPIIVDKPVVEEAPVQEVRQIQAPAALQVEKVAVVLPVMAAKSAPAPSPLPTPVPVKHDEIAASAKKPAANSAGDAHATAAQQVAQLDPADRDVEFQFYKGLVEHRVVLPGDQGQKGMRTAVSERPLEQAHAPDFSAIQSAVLKTVSSARPADGADEKAKFAPRDEAQNHTAEAWSPAKSMLYARNLQALSMGNRQGPVASVQSYLKRQDDAAQRQRYTPPPTGRVAEGMFVVQVAAFSRYEPAQKLLGRLMRQGEPARILPGTVNGAPVFRVRVGPFQNRTDADNTAHRWQVKGLSAMVTRHAPG
ncbi:Sporulation domain protein [Magnetococcus marinus MC-1]|uniref:Sporulation domain protein n=1 Tax=Magnetococcus marinus (strain ATCC BAA-1437 / JCM 17883 / MC-1) TaxID=156889 RepID=A0L5I3_MAGMM|nr:SPOR domain-containing protein [Magnetococcus marinus]ABK43226.1 Sporulation domain protein [Magnetococcus marinus MC-1]